MGAQNKWTVEEEASLKAGVAKHGIGNWHKILQDRQFGSILHSRFNVDLKDKWRNLENERSCELARAAGKLQKGICNIPLSRQLKEPLGSRRATIAAYIEEIHSVPSDLEKLLAAELKALTDCEKLVKEKNQYRIAEAAATTVKADAEAEAAILEADKEASETDIWESLHTYDASSSVSPLEYVIFKVADKEADGTDIWKSLHTYRAFSLDSTVAPEESVFFEDLDFLQMCKRYPSQGLKHSLRVTDPVDNYSDEPLGT